MQHRRNEDDVRVGPKRLEDTIRLDGQEVSLDESSPPALTVLEEVEAGVEMVDDVDAPEMVRRRAIED